MLLDQDTIAAPATPAGVGGVAMIRVSGQLVEKIMLSLCGRPLQPRVAEYVSFKNENQETVDQGIAIYFKAPNSFTGEEVLELHGHGNPILIDELMRCVIALGARQARPGEFSERAFLNHKMDLAQAEAIVDLIQAKSLLSAQSALRSMQGVFSHKVNKIVDDLIELRKYVEAAIDFSDEEIEFLTPEMRHAKTQELIHAIQALESQAEQGSILREGIRCVLTGAPNVGKSSLLNALSGHERAIVTPIAGTTRDTLHETILIRGIPFLMIDTAGLRESEDVVEQAGIERAKKAIEDADLILYLFSAENKEEEIVNQLKQDSLFSNKKIILVKNKMDLIQESCGEKNNLNHQSLFSISVKENQGLEILKTAMLKSVGWHAEETGIFSARRRHLSALAKARHALEMANQLSTTKAVDRFAEELRQAQLHLGDITGIFSSEDLLTEIFSSFCIGK